MSDHTIRALTPETFGDFAALVERNKGMFASCWCTWFHPEDREPDTAEDNRAFKKRRVDEGIAHAALVYDGDLAIAWAEYGTPGELPTSTTARSTSPLLSDFPTTGSPASRSSAPIEGKVWRRSPCAELSS
ncbi:hypothetical protein [Terracoccus sp. 273MFTsu3.1]|uniref:hypothetical protein n=1 Tax=Terracoccus sp. 273MFTsu3.1 TaxID=1172188 RepID=UPI0003A94938|nr:hypothetical protein [Terracoccus sp. 273MFTsu3.1]